MPTATRGETVVGQWEVDLAEGVPPAKARAALTEHLAEQPLPPGVRWELSEQPRFARSWGGR